MTGTPSTTTDDSLLGYPYMDLSDFKVRAAAFGCGGPVITVFNDTELTAALASASRAIEGYTNRDFLPDPQVETLHIDRFTRRVRVAKPPVALVTGAKLKTYPAATTIDHTELVVNNQEDYIEIPSGITGGFTPSGAYEYPDIEITYNTAQAMPPVQVVTATGYVAAEVINREYINRRVQNGLTGVETGDQSLSRAPFNPEVKIIPEIARQILANDSKAAPRVVPEGFPSRYTRGRYW